MEVEYKIRPVVRYSVTRHYRGPVDAKGRCEGGCETLGVFDNERSAERALAAFESDEKNASAGYVVWRDSIGVPATELYHAASRTAALELQDKLQVETEHTWRIARAEDAWRIAWGA